MDTEGILREIGYGDYHSSCKSLAITAEGELVECRRSREHAADVHACYGGPTGLITWADDKARAEFK